MALLRRAVSAATAAGRGVIGCGSPWSPSWAAAAAAAHRPLSDTCAKDPDPDPEAGAITTDEQQWLRQKRKCKRITGYDKQEGRYLRCNAIFTHQNNRPDACYSHEIGLFDKIGPGNWWNCCKSNDPEAIGCRISYHSDEIDDSDIRGHSIDPRKPEDLQKSRD